MPSGKWMHDGPPELLERQRAMAAAVALPAQGGLAPGDLLLCLDIQYDGETAHLGGALWRWGEPELGRVFVGEAAAGGGYHPGLFCFREGPPLLAFLHRLRAEGVRPDGLVVDGHGIAHPRGLGVASWLGLEAGLPSVGCAKRTLLPYEEEPDEARGSTAPVLRDGEVVGAVLRTRDGVKPLYVSVGHRVSLEASCAAILAMPGRFRLPDPLRAADQAARARARGEEVAAERLGDC
ncbi:MAG: endonuclease V [Alphaproteobacteria bacterium]|nr:endonuclease V [Alphaproteobacteria bacterium]